MKNNKSVTAVEWLIDEAMKLVVQYMQGTLNEDTLDDVIYKIGTKAKEMEKQEKIDFANNYGFDICAYDYERAEQYYNETFKSE